MRSNWASVAVGGPVQAEGAGGLAQPLDRPLVRLGHHPEQAGAVGQQRIGDGEVGGQRQSGVARLRREPRAKGQLEASVRKGGDLLLGRIDPRCAARRSSAAWMRLASSAKPAGRSASRTLS